MTYEESAMDRFRRDQHNAKREEHITELEAQLAASGTYAELLFSLLYESRPFIAGHLPIKGRINAALAKNPNPAGQIVRCPPGGNTPESGTETATPTPGPVGLGPTEARHEIGTPQVEPTPWQDHPAMRHIGGCFNDTPGAALCQVCGGDLPERSPAVGTGFEAWSQSVEGVSALSHCMAPGCSGSLADRCLRAAFRAGVKAGAETILSQCPGDGSSIEAHEEFWRDREADDPLRERLYTVPGTCTRAMARIGAQHFKGYKPFSEANVRLLIEDVATAWEDMISEASRETIKRCAAHQRKAKATLTDAEVNAEFKRRNPPPPNPGAPTMKEPDHG